MTGDLFEVDKRLGLKPVVDFNTYLGAAFADGACACSRCLENNGDQSGYVYHHTFDFQGQVAHRRFASTAGSYSVEGAVGVGGAVGASSVVDDFFLPVFFGVRLQAFGQLVDFVFGWLVLAEHHGIGARQQLVRKIAGVNPAKVPRKQRGELADAATNVGGSVALSSLNFSRSTATT